MSRRKTACGRWILCGGLPAGELSEIIGVATLETDRESRRLRLRRLAEQIYTELSPADSASFSAYARGVNGYIESHHGRYGMEFRLLGYDPSPWSAVDSILVGLHMFRTLTSDWKNKLVKDQMLRGGEPDKVNYPVPGRARGWNSCRARTCIPVPTRGPFPALTRPAANPCSQTTCTWSSVCPASGTWPICSAPGMNVEGVELPGVPGIIGRA